MNHDERKKATLILIRANFLTRLPASAAEVKYVGHGWIASAPPSLRHVIVQRRRAEREGKYCDSLHFTEIRSI